MKRTIALVMSLLLAATLIVACSNEMDSQATAETEPAAAAQHAPDPPPAEESGEDYSHITVAWVSPLVAHEFYDYAKQGMEDVGRMFGFQTYWTGADDHTSEMMIEAMERVIADGVDAIGTVPLSESAWAPILQRSVDMGIPVAAAAIDVSEHLRVGFVGTDSHAVGLKMIEESHRVAGTDELYIGILMSNLDTANQLIQKDAVEEYLVTNNIGGGGIVDVRETFGDSVTALTVSEQMLAAYPEMNIILAFTGEGGAAAGRAANEAGRDIVIIGMDDSEYTINAIRNGWQHASMAQNCYKWGFYTTKMAFLAAVGRLDEMQTLHIDSGVVMLTIDNLDTYAEEFYIMPEDTFNP